MEKMSLNANRQTRGSVKQTAVQKYPALRRIAIEPVGQNLRNTNFMRFRGISPIGANSSFIFARDALPSSMLIATRKDHSI